MVYINKILPIKIIFLCFLNISAAKASCSADVFSSPNDLFGQTFNCSDGSSYTYQRNELFGDTITNDSTGDTYNSDFLSNSKDEYGLFGRTFSDGNNSITLERGILGDSLYKY